jgi:hypothetical protein
VEKLVLKASILTNLHVYNHQDDGAKTDSVQAVLLHLYLKVEFSSLTAIYASNDSVSGVLMY